MNFLSIALRTVALVLLLAAPALAGQKDNEGIGWITVGPALLLLAAFPLATIFRALTRIPKRAAAVLEEKPWPALFLGVGNLVLLTVLGWAGEKSEIFGIVAAFFVLAIFLALCLGLTGVATRIGRRLFRDEEKGESVGAFALGWLLLAGIPLLPMVGFVVLLWLSAKAIGAALLSLHHQAPAEEPSDSSST